MAQLTISLPRAIGPRPARFIGFTLIGALVLWVGGYAAGFWPWLGYASQARSSINIGRYPVGEMSTGKFRLGFGTFVFFKGQKIVVSYDADIAAGCLSMHVWQWAGRGAGADDNKCVTASGTGEWAVPVAATGLYHIFVTSRPVKGRWDMSYAVWWGAGR